jgi:hypothetical protein
MFHIYWLMRIFKKLLFLSPALVLLLISSSFRTVSERIIQWEGIRQTYLDGMSGNAVLYFSGARYDFSKDCLPRYYESIAIPPNVAFEFNLADQVFERLTDDEISRVKDLDKIARDQIAIETFRSYTQKKPYAIITFVPLRYNSASRSFEKLTGFNLEFSYGPVSGDLTPKKHYKDNSVLSSGSWYKLAVSTTGVYKITYQNLSDWGINPATIDPRNARIYGNGGGMLSEDITVPRYDDLMENAIYVSGEEDGHFDAGDYILFYGQSPHQIKYNPLDGNFFQNTHLYSDYTYYFLNFDSGPGKRISSQPSSNLTPNFFVTQYHGMMHHELEDINLVKSGRIWYGEVFDILTSYSFDINVPGLDMTKQMQLKTDVAARSFVSSSFTLYASGSLLSSMQVGAISTSQNTDYAKAVSDTINFYPPSTSFTLKINYNKPEDNSSGWLNYFTLNYTGNLSYSGTQFSFRNKFSAGTGNVSRFSLSNSSSSVVIWNVTDPINVQQVEATLDNNTLSFTLPTETLLEFISFNGTGFYSPVFIEKTANQNLHASAGPDMVIITHPGFQSEALRLAAFHESHDGLSVLVTTPQVIYNEFSSGAPDITGIRDFMKFLYESVDPGKEPRYLLLFGDGSYDNKNRIGNNTGFIPTWQTRVSLSPVSSYVSDDYYGLLDDVSVDQTVDIGIGRFPVDNLSDAKAAVDKVIHYATNTSETMHDWRNVACLVADDEDTNGHLYDTELLMGVIETYDKSINIDKIYLDAFTQVSSPSGERYPDVNEALNKRIDKGALILNYVGHGGEDGWAHEKILTIQEIRNWTNFDRLPLFITATCEFSRFDDPGRISGGEYVFLDPDGGGIALFSTSRATYSGPNSDLNQKLLKYAFSEPGGEKPRLGDVLKLTKNDGSLTDDTDNIRKFVLLGDPAVTLAYPRFSVETTMINNHPVETYPDTAKALSQMTIAGEVRDAEGNRVEDFNGVLYPTVFDKPAQYTTLGNNSGSYPVTFTIQKNALFKGKASIRNGSFSFTFTVPKDIAYQYGTGKISYYAENGVTDAAGYSDDLVVGGYNPSAGQDLNGPEINLFMNDMSFRTDGLTDNDPVLLAFVSDESGINTTGTGIGHDIAAVLDGDIENIYILNDYYESELDDCTKGLVTYPFSSLSPGKHVLSFKIWDIFNNSSEETIVFEVQGASAMVIEDFLIYPNPVAGQATFSFEHNQPDKEILLDIRMYTLSGKLAWTFTDTYYGGGYRYVSGIRSLSSLNPGIYVCRLEAKTPDGLSGEATTKMVLIK